MQDFFERNESLDVPDSVKRLNLYNELRSCILKHPANEVNFHFIYYWGINLAHQQVNDLINIVDSSIQNAKSRSWAESILKRTSVAETGKPFPALCLTDTSGNELVLSSLKGKTVLIDVWSSGCVPCREQIPELRKLYKKYRSKDFEIIGISIDYDREHWLKAIRKDKQNWKQYCELVNWQINKFSRRFSVYSIPANFLLDENGILVSQDVPVEKIRLWLKQHY